MAVDELCAECKRSDSSDSDVNQDAGLMGVAVECQLHETDAMGEIHHYFTNASGITFVAFTKASTEERSGVIFTNDLNEKEFETELNFRRSLLRKAEPDLAPYKVRLHPPSRTDSGSRATVTLDTRLTHGTRAVRSIAQLKVPFAIGPRD